MGQYILEYNTTIRQPIIPVTGITLNTKSDLPNQQSEKPTGVIIENNILDGTDEGNFGETQKKFWRHVTPMKKDRT